MKPQMDLNLIFIAESLYRTLNVSKTAQELNMSQSAVSHSLAKMREHFNDPLFVRVSKGMAPTEAAKTLRAEITALSERARNLLQRPESFTPKTAQGRITIATTDMMEIVLMPQLLCRLEKEAPGIQVSIRPTGGELPKAQLENGEIDFAIAGFYKNLPEGFFQTKILDLGFSTAFRKGHPKIKGTMTANQFYDLDHALITLQGDFKDSLKQKNKERHFAYGSYSFTGMAWTLASTDLILTAPTVLLQKYKQFFPIVIQNSPVEIPKVEIRMVWHALTHQDPTRIWFRQVLKDELAKALR